jgi:glycosyltransferase involved in cell wall biosynthesis
LLLPNGTEPHAVRCVPVAEARRQLDVPGDRRIVGFLGVSQGDLDVVMDALGRLPDVWLMVVGPESARVRGQARARGIAERLWQTGFVPEHRISLYLGCADVMCLPMVDRAANRGRLPGKLSYYLAAGRPTVASPIGDVTALVETERVGLLADGSGFAAAIDRLLRDPELRAELGQNARRAAETTFSWSRLVDPLEDFYRRVLAWRRSPRSPERAAAP